MGRVTRILVHLAALVAMALALAGFTADDDRPWERAGTFVADGQPFNIDEATSHCRPPPPDICVYTYPPIRETCAVGEVKELGRFGSDQYLTIRYLRSRTYDEGEGREPYVCASDEIHLVAFATGGRARTVWRDATEREFVFISSVRHSSFADGTTVLAILYCLNGTGGCVQGLLIWSGDRWKRLERDASWEPVYRNLPAGYRPHKSPQIDLGTLTWEQHLAYDTDANCCPSGTILFELAIIDDKLAVKSYRIVVPEPNRDLSDR